MWKKGYKSGSGGRGEPGKGDEGDGRVAIVLSDQNFPACLPAVSGKCLVVIRQEDALLSDLVLRCLPKQREKSLPSKGDL